MRNPVATVLVGLTVLGLSMSAMGQQGDAASSGARGAMRGTDRSGAERARQAGVLDKTKKTSPDSEETTPGAGKANANSVQVRGVVTEVTTGTLSITEKSGQVTVLHLRPDTQVRGNRTLDVSRLKERQRVRMDGSLSSDETTFTAKVIHLVPEKSARAGIGKTAGGFSATSPRDAVLRKNQAIGELVIQGKKAVLICGDKNVPVVFGPNPKVMEAINGTPQMLAPGMNVFVIGRETAGKKMATLISLDTSAEAKKPNAKQLPPSAGKTVDAKVPAVEKVVEKSPAKAPENAAAANAPAK